MVSAHFHELLKNTLINKKEFITIKEEIDNLKHYLSIMAIRYAGNFHVSYDVEDELLTCQIPKLILQPLAENSIIHGYRNDGTVLEVFIHCYRLNHDIILELSDNGKGFTTECEKPNPVLSGIGTNNVNNRIRLNFGEEFGLSIISTPEQGTTCKIKIPEIRI